MTQINDCVPFPSLSDYEFCAIAFPVRCLIVAMQYVGARFNAEAGTIGAVPLLMSSFQKRSRIAVKLHLTHELVSGGRVD
jgi:hypothetical protein